MLTKAADELFSAIKKRVYKVVPLKARAKGKRKKSQLWALGRDGIRYKLSLTQEENPKWSLLKEVLAETESLRKAKSAAQTYPFGELREKTHTAQLW